MTRAARSKAGALTPVLHDPKQPPLPPRSAPAALEFAWERPSAIAREVDGLAQRFAKEVGRTRYEIDWDRVFALERANAASIWTARTIESRVLVGYFGCTFNVGLFTSAAYTRIEAGYLAPEWRGPEAVRCLKALIASHTGASIEWETNDAFEPDANGRSRLATLLERLGFTQVGTVMRLQ